MKVALQLYTVRDKMKVDYISTLRAVADVGYKYVEFAGHPFMSIDVLDLKKFLNEIGIKPVSAHVGFNDLENGFNEIISYAKSLGLKYLVSEPDVREISSLNECLKITEKMNKIGKKVSDNGLRFGIHNHAIEFNKKFDGKTVYDIFVENTDPSLVFFQPDVYWIKYAGYDPVKVIEKLENRCFLVHLKDMKDEVSKDMIELGQGILNFKDIVKACEKAGTEYYIVENDRPSMDSIISVKKALEYLKENFEIE